VLGVCLGALQLLCLPLLSLFSPLKEVQQAARLPSVVAAALQLINGVVFIGEGIQQVSHTALSSFSQPRMIRNDANK